MDTAGRFGIKFTNKQAFGNACTALTRDGVSFSLAGFQTIVISAEDYKKLNEPAKSMLASRPPDVELFILTPHEKRGALPTAKEAKDLLQKFTRTSR